MLRGLFKLLLLIVVVVAAGAFLLGWWGGRAEPDRPAEVIGTAGEQARDASTAARAKTAQAAEKTADAAETAKDKTVAAAETAREKLGPAAEEAKERTAEAARQARKALADGSLTAKIKAKMALDDHVKALDLNVDTAGTVVTVSGSVRTEQERDRALALARETAGVTQVIDKMTIRR